MSETSAFQAGNAQKRLLPVFIALSLLISWIFWSPLLASAAGLITEKIEITNVTGFALYIVAMTGMWIAAIPLVIRTEGVPGVVGRLKSLLDLKKYALTYIVAILVPFAVEILAPAIFAIGTGSQLPSIDLTYVIFLLFLGVHVAIVLALAGSGFAMPLFGMGRSRGATVAIMSVYTLVWLIPMCLNTILHYPGSGTVWYVIGFIPAVLLVFLTYYLSK